MRLLFVQKFFYLAYPVLKHLGTGFIIVRDVLIHLNMGLEKIDFGWYFKNITLLAFLGYVAGVAAIYLESVLMM